MLLVSAAVAAAQTAPPPPAPPAPGWGHHGVPRRGPQDWQAERAKMEERRLAELHTKLDLKPGQEPAWQAFVTGLQAARPPRKPHEKQDWEKMQMETTPERLDHMLAHIDEMRAHVAQLDQVVKAFYAGLSKDQQTIFDDNFKGMGGPHGGPGAWEHQGMGHDHMGHGPMEGPPMGPPGGPVGPPPQD
jgi:hypothetical protein